MFQPLSARRATLAGLLLWAAPASAQWTLVYEPPEAGQYCGVTAFAATDGRFYAAVSRYPSGSDIVATADGAAWASLGAPFPNYAYVVDDLYAKGQTILAGYSGGQVGGVLRSDDGGAAWRAWNAGFGGENYVYALAVDDETVFAASIRGVYRAALRG